jgi:hypothetical protein
VPSRSKMMPLMCIVSPGIVSHEGEQIKNRMRYGELT